MRKKKKKETNRGGQSKDFRLADTTQGISVTCLRLPEETKGKKKKPVAPGNRWKMRQKMPGRNGKLSIRAFQR